LTGERVAVSVLDQVPDFPRDIQRCKTRAAFYNRDFRSCVTQPAAAFESKHRILSDYFGFLQKHYSFSIASAAEAICNQEQCVALDGETILMSDSHHLSVAGALRAVPYLRIPLLTGPRAEEAQAREIKPSASGSPSL